MHDKANFMHCNISVTSPAETEFDFGVYGILQQQCIFITCVQRAFFTDGIGGNDHTLSKQMLPKYIASLEQG